MTDSGRTADEIGQLGQEWFERRTSPSLRPEDTGRYLAIDVDSGEYELGDDDLTTINRLRARLPGAEMWLCIVGQDGTDRMGFRP